MTRISGQEKRPSGSRPDRSAWIFLDRLAIGVLTALILLPPLVFDPLASENFRLPKYLLSEFLVLVSLLLLSFRLLSLERVRWRAVLLHPAVLAVTPLVAVAGLGVFFSAHPGHAWRGFGNLAIGAAALVAWSFALTPREVQRLLRLTVVPAVLLSVIAILQFHEIWTPFEFAQAVSRRRGLTSFAGGALDLGAYLVLPTLVTQLELYRAAPGWRRRGLTLVLLLLVYGIGLTQTITALIALVAGTLVLWSRLLTRRHLLVASGLVLTLGLVAGLAIEPLRQRLGRKVFNLEAGQLNIFLSGRLDGWRAALHMLEGQPWLGIGPGTYTTEYAATKLELLETGVQFHKNLKQPHFSTAHNEYLEIAAECGILGLIALAAGLGVVGWRLRTGFRLRGQSVWKALPAAALMALAILALAGFPMHLAIVAWPYILLVSWILDVEVLS